MYESDVICTNQTLYVRIRRYMYESDIICTNQTLYVRIRRYMYESDTMCLHYCDAVVCIRRDSSLICLFVCMCVCIFRIFVRMYVCIQLCMCISHDTQWAGFTGCRSPIGWLFPQIRHSIRHNNQGMRNCEVECIEAEKSRYFHSTTQIRGTNCT